MAMNGFSQSLPDAHTRMRVLRNHIEEPVINQSFRRMPESIALNSLDPGMRRDDEKRIHQKFLEFFSFRAFRGYC
jgi:hypothetical protein